MGLLSRAEEIRYVDRLGEEFLQAYERVDDAVHEAFMGDPPTRYSGLSVKMNWCEVPEISESEVVREMNIAIRDMFQVPWTLLGGR